MCQFGLDRDKLVALVCIHGHMHFFDLNEVVHAVNHFSSEGDLNI